MAAAAPAAGTAERVLVYPGSADDVGPLMLLESKDSLVKTSDALADLVACADLEKSDSADVIVDIFESVDRFVMFDIAPYCQGKKTQLSPVYASFDHYVKFVEVYLRKLVTSGSITHNKEERYFECTVRRTDGKKHLEWYYGTDFFDIKPESRIHHLMQTANVVYQQGWFVKDDPHDPDAITFYSAFPNADTVLMQAVGHDLTREEHQKRFEKHSTHDRGVRVFLHPSLTRGIYDLAN